MSGSVGKVPSADRHPLPQTQPRRDDLSRFQVGEGPKGCIDGTSMDELDGNYAKDASQTTKSIQILDIFDEQNSAVCWQV